MTNNKREARIRRHRRVRKKIRGTPERPRLSVFGDDYDTPDGTCVRDYVHVEDLARAHVAALGRLQSGTPEIAVNLGTGTGFSVLEVVDTARRVTGRPIAHRVVARIGSDHFALCA